jgi:diguanylate cyclase (GGDEF)-like protein
MDRLERALKRTKAPDEKSFVVLALNIDNLKMIGDSLGYLIGDQLIVQVARRIQGCLSVNETVAHFGTGEFVLLLEETRGGRDATVVANRLHVELEKPFQIEGQTVYISASTGIAIGTVDYSCPEEVLRDASTAMHRAKAGGKARFEIFDTGMRSTAVARLKLESDLRRALEQHEFRVHYQPIVSLKTGRLKGFEALVRWSRRGQIVLPEEFLPVLESMDLIIPLEQWVLLESCFQMAKWRKQTEDPLTLSVNLCAKHYSSPHLVDELKEVLQRWQLDPTSLILEITESALMEKTGTVEETLSQIQDLSVQVHMDDFGTGYSSLSYLHRFPINSLKIDRSFVGSLGMNYETSKIVQAIASLASGLGMGVIAEGIENHMQMQILQSLNCEHGQGYYFSKPLDPRAIEPLISGEYPWSAAFGKGLSRGFPFAIPDKDSFCLLQ